MERAGGEIGDHLTAGAVEDGSGRDADEGLAVFLVEGFVNPELAEDGDGAFVGGWVGRILGGVVHGQRHLFAERILGKVRGFVMGFQGERAAGHGTGGGPAFESEEPVAEQVERRGVMRHRCNPHGRVR